MSTATVEILRVCESLSPEKQQEVADFAAFLLARETGDEAWEGIINSPDFLPKLEAFDRASAAEGDEPLDLKKL